MQETRFGYFGKIPTVGDFISRGLPRRVADGLDGWLREAVRASQTKLGPKWLDAFLVAPVWRLAIAPGVLGPYAVAGVMIPSVDRVGRYFPLIVAAAIPEDKDDPFIVRPDSRFFAAAEALALSTLNDQFTLAKFDEGIGFLPDPDRTDPEDRGETLCWTEGNHNAVHRFLGLPEPADFSTVFLGNQAAPAAPDIETTAAPAPNTPSSETRAPLMDVDFGHASLKGLRSASLGDRVAISDQQQAFSLISPIGNDIALTKAIESITPDFANIENPFSMNDLLAEAKGKLGRANTKLRARGAPSGTTYAASVATLLIQAQRYAVLWAGSAHVLQLRDHTLTPLTRPHLDPRVRTLITRALGSSGSLSPDNAIGQAMAGDRYVIASPGLFDALGAQEIGNSLARAGNAQEAAHHLTQDALIAGAPLDATALVVFLLPRA